MTVNECHYYMASSVTGQDELNPVLSVIGYLRGQNGTLLPARTNPCVPQENTLLFPYNKSFIGQACAVKRARYWPCSFWVFLHVHKHAKKYLPNIQPF